MEEQFPLYLIQQMIMLKRIRSLYSGFESINYNDVEALKNALEEKE